MIQDDTRTAASARVAAYAFVGLMVGLLITSSQYITRTSAEAADLRTQLAELQAQDDSNDVLIAQLMTERELLRADIDRLEAITPTERIILQPCEDRPTPAFPRESQFVGAHR